MKLPPWAWALWRRLETIAPDELSLRLMYRRKTGRLLGLKNPRAFGEKIQWMKLNYRPPELAALADKFTVRAFVAERIGARVLNQLHGCWDRPEDIPFDSLPDRYALKVSSASHANLFCWSKGALDPVDARRQLTQWLAQNSSHGSREWAYQGCRPRILCEAILDEGTGDSPVDYKFFCFDGRPMFVEACVGRHRKLTQTMLDLQWHRLPITSVKHPPHPTDIRPPATLDEMIAFATTLSTGYPFMRVDFYCIFGRTVFGEITWYPGSGLVPFYPYERELEIGAMLRLPAPVPG